MPPGILQTLQTVVLGAGASTTIAHGLTNGENVVIPNRILPDRSTAILVVTADDTDVTYNNPSGDAATAIFLVQFDHTIQQATPTGAQLQYWWQGGGGGGGGGGTWTITSVINGATGSYNATEFDLVQINPDTADVTVNLPAVSAANSGQSIVVKRVDTGAAFDGFVHPNGTDEIDGVAADYLMDIPQSAFTFVSNGVDGWVLI